MGHRRGILRLTPGVLRTQSDDGGTMGTRSRHLAPALMAALAGGILGCSGEALGPVSAKTSSPALSVATTGNGAPSGAHYNLNIVAVANDKNANMDNDGGHTIFVLLGTKDAGVRSKIMLEQSASAGEFAVPFLS